MQVCHFLEMREHHWVSMKDISSKTGKLKRALLQFTPESWNHSRWLDPGCSWMRFIGIFQFILIWQVMELNTFFVKHIFPMPTQHPICVTRILILGVMAAPATRYLFKPFQFFLMFLRHSRIFISFPGNIILTFPTKDAKDWDLKPGYSFALPSQNSS